MNFYNFEASKINGDNISMSDYEGKTIIVVNTASKCGFTPQFEGLEKLYEKYKQQGLIILGFPCNQFGKQEPGVGEEIQEFCQINYGVTFPIFDKVNVNGSTTHPIFKYLKSNLGGFFGSSIKWNFTKFVIDKTGKPIKRFGPTKKPEDMDSFIKFLMI